MRLARVKVVEEAAIIRACRIKRNHHCEERSDEAIQNRQAPCVPLDRVASLAMTATAPSGRAML
jgi:hypothetical protein